ncbi:MAG TPA: Ig-like domain-containing protein, partial [Candidatus Saccharimonadales bacterium]
GLTATAASSSQVNLSWAAPTGTDAAAKYEIYRNGSTTALASVNAPTTTYTDTTAAASTQYSYTVLAVDANGNKGPQSTKASATTPAATDTTAPVVSMTAPASGATVSGIASVSANATDNVRVTSLQFELDGTPLGAAIGTPTTGSTYTYSWNTTAVSNGPHALTAIASDGTNKTTAKTVTVTVNNGTGGGGGGTTPTTVQNLAFNATTKTLSWSAYPGAASYTIAEVHNPTGSRNTNYAWPHIIGTGCAPGSTCNVPTPASGETVSFGINPLDSNGNALAGSTWAKEITVTWPASTADTTPPSQSTALNASPVSSSQINLTWTASTDNVGVTGYQVYRTSSSSSTPALIGTASGTSYGDTGLTASTLYRYYIVAIDAAQNKSQASVTDSATTKSAATTTATIEGTIKNSKTLQPINGVFIRTGNTATASGYITTTTNAQGQYLLTSIDMTQKHNYYFYANGYQNGHAYLQFPANAKTNNVNTLDLSMVPK